MFVLCIKFLSWYVIKNKLLSHLMHIISRTPICISRTILIKLCTLQKFIKITLPACKQLQVQNPHNIKYSGTVQGLKYIWRTEGFRGLFKGNGTNCARIVPNSAVKFFSYEQASKYVVFSDVVPLTKIFLVHDDSWGAVGHWSFGFSVCWPVGDLEILVAL